MITAIVLASAITAGGCGQLQHNEAGGDYTNPSDAQKLSVVEAFHFTADVEQLRRGISDKLGGDIGYTLEHFPNHHRALAVGDQRRWRVQLQADGVSCAHQVLNDKRAG